ncbi:50S ribosomal protein L25/general stress protein Ctc [Alphaproteobacteria bacterium]|nr:50S ribosomal protein L25/general stress protein Ctc [Alphaproteobacteria bacterium]
MADIITLVAEPRMQSGKGTAREARRNGRIPAVIYGNKEDPVSITVERRILEQELGKSGFFIRLLDVDIDGTMHRVLPRDTQYHPVTDVPLHVDFLRYSADRKITVEIPVRFLNEAESPGLISGGVINIVRHTIAILCIADQIPDGFEIDLTGLEIGDSVHANMLALPEGVELTITDRDFTIATIAAPTVMPVDEEEEEGEEGEDGVEGAEGAEGEEGDAAPGDANKEESGNE